MSLACPSIAADRHPVTVARSDGSITYPHARLILTIPGGDDPGRLLVWVRPDQAVLDLTWTREGSRVGSGAWTLATTDGEWTVTRERGCGCSSPLKTMPLPWSSYRMRTGALQ